MKTQQWISKQKYVQFSNLEKSVGINFQNFFNKFVFHQNSDLQAFYINIKQITPSQYQNMSLEQINICIYMMSQLIFKAGQCLRLPVSTSIVAVSIAQYFYTRKSFIDQDFREVAMGAMFLACKSEQTLRRSYQIAYAFYYIFKIFQGGSYIGKKLFYNQEEYNFVKTRVLKIQSQILFDLGFQIYKLFDIPTRYISGLLYLFGKHPKSLQISQTSWIYLNDIYKTRACLYFPGQFLASAAVYISLIKLKITHPTCAWWILMESNIQYVQYICLLIQEMKQTLQKGKVNFSNISVFLQNIGFKKNGLKNVFPEFYYRKISMQLLGNYKIIPKKEIQLVNTLKVSSIQSAKLSSQFHHFKQRQKDENVVMQSQISQRKNHHEKKERHKHKSKHKKNKQKKHKNKYDQGNRFESPSNKEIQLSDKETSKVLKLSKNQFFIPNFQHALQNQQKIGQDKRYPIKQELKLNQKEANALKTKQLQVKNSKDLLSKINLQLKKHEIKREIVLQKNDQVSPNLADNQLHQQSKDSQQDEQLLAALIKIKKDNKKQINQEKNNLNSI